MYTLRVLLVWRCFFNHFEALKVHKFCDMSGDKHRLMICFSQSAAFDKNSSNPIWINLESKKQVTLFASKLLSTLCLSPEKTHSEGALHHREHSDVRKVLDTCHYCFSFVIVVSARRPRLPSHRGLSLWWVNSATFDPWRTATRRLWHSSPASSHGRSLPVTPCAYVCVWLLFSHKFLC